MKDGVIFCLMNKWELKKGKVKSTLNIDIKETKRFIQPTVNTVNTLILKLRPIIRNCVICSSLSLFLFSFHTDFQRNTVDTLESAHEGFESLRLI